MTTLESWPLNTTKLHPPRVTANLVIRPRLVEKLNRGVLGPMTLVCAGAGYGKTTLVSAWLERRADKEDAGGTPMPAAWLSLDEYDSDLTIFLRYLCAALRTIFPQACARTLALLLAPQQAPLNEVIAALGSELTGLPEDFILVLEDFHTIKGTEVPDLLSGLARHWPQPLHLLLITRRNPPLPLAGLRAKDDLTEFRTRDLQFTTGEVVQYLTTVLGQAPSEAVLAQLIRQTEGWIVGLHLAMSSLSSDVDAVALDVLAETNSNIVAYLIDELLSQQPPDVMTFLLETACLDRFCVSLCTEVMDISRTGRDARACLEWLDRANFPITALDDRREWYRHHRLLQDLLRVRAATALGPERAIELHRRAVTWFAQRGLIEEALQHALAAQDLEQAAVLMEHAVCTVLNCEDTATLRRWLRMLPEDFRRRRPGLLMIEAWDLHFSFRLGELPELLQRVEALIGSGAEMLAVEEAQLLRGQLLALRGQIAYFSGQAVRGSLYVQEALSLLPQSCTFVRGVCIYYLALSGQDSGQGDAVERTLWACYEAASDKGDPYAVRILGALCFTGIQAGMLEKARQTSVLLLEQARRGAMVLVEGWAHYWLGLVHYEWNDLAIAAQHFQLITQQRYSLHSFTAREGMLGMMQVQIAAGDLAGTQQTLDFLSQYDVDTLGHETAKTLAARALLQFHQGDKVSAGRWADAFTVPLLDQPLYRQDAHIARARLLLARGSAVDVQTAQVTIAEMLAIAERTCNTRYAIALLALHALALDAEGQTRAALASLRHAIELAQAGGFIRTFVDLGARLQMLLSRLARQGVATGYIEHILNAFPSMPSHSSQSLSPSQGSAAPAALVEPLTSRELDVLALLAQRLSAKEIAAQLVISEGTVKRHVANIYDKLAVNNRREAVAAAIALGLLPSSP